MDSNKFLGILKMNGKNIEWLTQEMNKNGCPISGSTIYKKIRGDSQFNALEIKVISEIMNFNKDEMYSIFFGELVS